MWPQLMPLGAHCRASTHLGNKTRVGSPAESLPCWVTLGMSSCNPISALLLPWQPQELLVEAI